MGIAAILLLAPLSVTQGQTHQVPIHARSTDSQLAIKVKVNGELVDFGGPTPVMQGSRILVPLRGVFEKLGATLAWNADTRTVSTSSAGKKIVLPVGKSGATIDGKPVSLDQPAMIIDQVTFVPLRFLGEALGAKVDWLQADRTIDIHTTGS